MKFGGNVLHVTIRVKKGSNLTKLNVRRTRLSTVGDKAFPVAAARLWNSLPSHVTAAPFLSIFCSRLSHISSHLLILLSDSSVIFTVPAQRLVILDTIIVITLNIFYSIYR